MGVWMDVEGESYTLVTEKLIQFVYLLAVDVHR